MLPLLFISARFCTEFNLLLLILPNAQPSEHQAERLVSGELKEGSQRQDLADLTHT
jgi:hypothetical protein